MQNNFSCVVAALLLPVSQFCDTVTVAAPGALQKRNLQVGAFAMDITPVKYPVVVNGMFEERTADRAVDPLFARAFVFRDGQTRIAIGVVDSCMLPRELLNEAKSQASKRTGIPTDHMLISATHTHSAPSAMGCLGSRADPEYPAFLVPRLARAIEKANDRLQPAEVGFAKIHAPNYTFCRRYIRRPDRMLKDPFGQLNVRAHMHPGFMSPDAIGPSGPVDDELSLIAMRTPAGKLIGVLANFSMHYIGSALLSSDYFGRFSEHLGKRIDGSDGATSCIVSMSQGTSGDLAGMNYNAPAAKLDYDSYANELAEIAAGALRNVQYKGDISLAMVEAKLRLRRRVPDAKRLAWAKQTAAKIGDRRPKGWPEIYALEQIFLADEPERELKLQALRIGDIAIAAIPDEVFAITGLKLKLQSPLANTFTMELANGNEGYIPPPEQHMLGGYTTWPARTAGLDVQAEPKIVDRVLKLLEQVTGIARRPLPEPGGAYTAAVLKSKPSGYWPLGEIAGNIAADASGNRRNARYEDFIAHYLQGPARTGFTTTGQASRAAHLAGGRVLAEIPELDDSYTAELWFWNGLPNDARPTTGYLFSRGPDHHIPNVGDHLAIGGKTTSAGRLIFDAPGSDASVLLGKSLVEPKTWNYVALVRDGDSVRVYLNGKAEPELSGSVPPAAHGLFKQLYFGGRNDRYMTFEGKMCNAAIYNRALPVEELSQHYAAAGLETAKGG